MLLKTTALTKSYLTASGSVDALREAELAFSENSFTCIVGKSGCGKTTLLRLLAGLEPATSGTITYEKATKIGFVFQEPRLMPWLTVSENIAFAAQSNPVLLHSPSEELLGLLGLQAFKNAYPAQLSGGMAQRVALGRTLFQNPDLILMDEPFSALDYFTRQGLQKMLLELFRQQQKSVIFVTHDVEEALLLGQRILVMQNGSVKNDLPIDLAYPRQTASLPFQQLRRQILDAIEN